MAEPLRDPKELQAQVESFQRMQRQVSIIASQRQQMLMQIEELKMAQEYLSGAKADAQIYKAIGNILVQTDKKGADKEIGERIEVFEVREKALKKQEEGGRQKLDGMRAEIEKVVSQK
ncbi:MAG: prefoldin subunit beta [Candidatus Micrarchaeota archaeon]